MGLYWCARKRIREGEKEQVDIIFIVIKLILCRSITQIRSMLSLISSYQNNLMVLIDQQNMSSQILQVIIDSTKVDIFEFQGLMSIGYIIFIFEALTQDNIFPKISFGSW